MLAANRAIHHCHAGFNGNSTGGSRSNRAIDNRKVGTVLIDVIQYVPNEIGVLKWKTNVHHVTVGQEYRLIDIHAERLIRAIHNFHQRLANFAQTHDDNRFVHSFDG